MSELICPLCGNEEIKNHPTSQTVREPFGGAKKVKVSNYICDVCGFDGDLLKENDNLLQDTISELKSNAVKNILDEFSEHNVNFASMERALELPQRTLSKWKNKTSKPSASGIALIKYLYLFPWLIEVAEKNYNYNEAQKIHIFDAFKKTIENVDFTPHKPTNVTTAAFGIIFKKENQTNDFEELDKTNSVPDDDFGYVKTITPAVVTNS
ncbi:MAG: hypothetical protein R6V54_00470 [Desulfobacteraceae bacterium]